MYKKQHGFELSPGLQGGDALKRFDDQDLAELRCREPEAVERFESYFAPLIRLKLRAIYPPRRRYEEGLTREVLWSVLAKLDEGLPVEPRKLAGLVVEVCHDSAKRAICSVFRVEQTQSALAQPTLSDLLFD